MKENIKICVVGSGRWGQNHITTLYKMGNLYGIVEKDNERLNTISEKYESIKCFSSLEEAVSHDFDGFIVATNAETHYHIAKFLLEHSKNVLVEKPMALKKEEGEELVTLSKKNNCNLLVGHQLLFHPAIIKIKELIDSGEIGNLLYLSSSRQNLGTVRKKENVIWSFAPHDISLLNYLTGETVETTNSFASAFLQEGIYDKATIELTYKKGVKGYIHVSWLHPSKEQKLIAVGDRGMITFDDASKDKSIVLSKRWVDTKEEVPKVRDDGTSVVKYDYAMPLEKELKYFVSLIDSKRVLENGEVGYEVVKILENLMV